MLKRIGTFVALTSCLATACFASPANPSYPHKIATNMSSRILDLSDLLPDDRFVFAVKNDKTGVVSYTHFALFLKHADNYFYQNDNRLLGFAMPDASTLTSDACTIIPVKAPDDVSSAKATTLMKSSLILDATASVPQHPFNEEDSLSYNFVTNQGIFDQSGNLHQISLFYSKSTSTNLWDVHVMWNHQLIATGTLQFAPSGRLDVATGLDQITFTPDGQAPQTVKLEFDIYSFAMPFSVRSFTNNGHQRGEAMEEVVDPNGYISEFYSNGEQVTFSKIAVYLDPGK